MRTTPPWPPIPDHAIEIAGRAMLPERLTYVDGTPYVRCYLHGLIPADHRCAESPSDHFCGVAAHPNQREGDDHDDQACSHDLWDHIQSDKLHAIADLHHKALTDDGGTDGGCAECGLPWPCRTAHYANSWGDPHDCENAGWCRHAGVPVDKWW